MFLGIYDIDEYVAIPAATHRFSSGAAYQPTALTYSIYEEGGTTGLDENVDMTPASPFDAITGAYLARRQLTAAAGFERDKTYIAIVKATVDSVAAVEMHVFQIRQKQTGDAYARLGAPAGASVSADIAVVSARVPGIAKNTALSNFEFMMIDSADHVSPKTGLTITAQRSIDGAAFGACANSASEVSNGVYKINLAAADLNGDVITLLFTATGADARLITIRTTA